MDRYVSILREGDLVSDVDREAAADGVLEVFLQSDNGCTREHFQALCHAMLTDPSERVQTALISCVSQATIQSASARLPLLLESADREAIARTPGFTALFAAIGQTMDSLPLSVLCTYLPALLGVLENGLTRLLLRYKQKLCRPSHFQHLYRAVKAAVDVCVHRPPGPNSLTSLVPPCMVLVATLCETGRPDLNNLAVLSDILIELFSSALVSELVLKQAVTSILTLPLPCDISLRLLGSTAQSKPSVYVKNTRLLHSALNAITTAALSPQQRTKSDGTVLELAANTLDTFATSVPCNLVYPVAMQTLECTAGDGSSEACQWQLIARGALVEGCASLIRRKLRPFSDFLLSKLQAGTPLEQKYAALSLDRLAVFCRPEVGTHTVAHSILESCMKRLSDPKVTVQLETLLNASESVVDAALDDITEHFAEGSAVDVTAAFELSYTLLKCHPHAHASISSFVGSLIRYWSKVMEQRSTQRSPMTPISEDLELQDQIGAMVKSLLSNPETVSDGIYLATIMLEAFQVENESLTESLSLSLNDSSLAEGALEYFKTLLCLQKPVQPAHIQLLLEAVDRVVLRTTDDDPGDNDIRISNLIAAEKLLIAMLTFSRDSVSLVLRTKLEFAVANLCHHREVKVRRISMRLLLTLICTNFSALTYDTRLNRWRGLKHYSYGFPVTALEVSERVHRAVTAGMLPALAQERDKDTVAELCLVMQECLSIFGSALLTERSEKTMTSRGEPSENVISLLCEIITALLSGEHSCQRVSYLPAADLGAGRPQDQELIKNAMYLTDAFVRCIGADLCRDFYMVLRDPAAAWLQALEPSTSEGLLRMYGGLLEALARQGISPPYERTGTQQAGIVKEVSKTIVPQALQFLRVKQKDELRKAAADCLRLLIVHASEHVGGVQLIDRILQNLASDDSKVEQEGETEWAVCVLLLTLLESPLLKECSSPMVEAIVVKLLTVLPELSGASLVGCQDYLLKSRQGNWMDGNLTDIEYLEAAQHKVFCRLIDVCLKCLTGAIPVMDESLKIDVTVLLIRILVQPAITKLNRDVVVSRTPRLTLHDQCLGVLKTIVFQPMTSKGYPHYQEITRKLASNPPAMKFLDSHINL